MIIVLFGPPGAGKGTQGTRLAAHFSIPHFSTGDMLRAVAEDATPLGNVIRDLLARGQFASDDLMREMIADRIARPDHARGFILDGFPRSVPQAHILEGVLQAAQRKIDHAVALEVDEGLLAQRIAGRAAAAGVPRADDTPDVLRERLRVYHEKTAPVLEYYDSSGLLSRVSGEGDIPKITQSILGRISSSA